MFRFVKDSPSQLSILTYPAASPSSQHLPTLTHQLTKHQYFLFPFFLLLYFFLFCFCLLLGVVFFPCSLSCNFQFLSLSLLSLLCFSTMEAKLLKASTTPFVNKLSRPNYGFPVQTRKNCSFALISLGLSRKGIQTAQASATSVGYNYNYHFSFLSNFYLFFLNLIINLAWNC